MQIKILCNGKGTKRWKKDKGRGVVKRRWVVYGYQLPTINIIVVYADMS